MRLAVPRIGVAVLAGLALAVAQVAGGPAGAAATPYDFTVAAGGDEGWPPAPRVTADSAILLEVSTGRVLYEKDADVRRQSCGAT